MEEKFLAFVSEIMEVEEGTVTMDSVYGELDEWDSMMMLTLIMEIEDEYGVAIPIEKVGTIKTMRDLFSLACC